jgi:hypothetical protein
MSWRMAFCRCVLARAWGKVTAWWLIHEAVLVLGTSAATLARLHRGSSLISASAAGPQPHDTPIGDRSGQG